MIEDGLIKISKMAEMHGISRQTLILYDKNDLFKPVYTNEKGYRFYSVNQVPQLREICFLKEMGVPLSAISVYMRDPTTEALQGLLSKRESAIDAEILELERQRRFLRQRQQLHAHVPTMEKNVNKPFYEWFPERKVIFEPYPSQDMDQRKLHLTLMRAWERLSTYRMLPSSGFGSLIRSASIGGEDPLEGAGSIIVLPFPEGIDDADLVTLPAGEYVTMYKYAMPYDLGPTERLLAWMGEQGLQPSGDVVDICILDLTFHDERQEDFCRLEVRVG